MANREKHMPASNVIVSVAAMVFHDGDIKVALKMRETEPFRGHLVLPNDFMAAKEGPDGTARRIMKGAGMRPVRWEQVYAAGGQGVNAEGAAINVVYLALIGEVPKGLILAGVRRLSRVAFGHEKLVDKCLARLKKGLGDDRLVPSLMPGKFTIYELQRAYEIIGGKFLDKRNFRRKLASSRALRPTRKKALGRQRPARIYVFKK